MNDDQMTATMGWHKGSWLGQTEYTDPSNAGRYSAGGAPDDASSVAYAYRDFRNPQAAQARRTAETQQAGNAADQVMSQRPPTPEYRPQNYGPTGMLGMQSTGIDPNWYDQQQQAGVGGTPPQLTLPQWQQPWSPNNTIGYRV